MAMTELGQLNVTYRGDEADQIFLTPVFFDEDLMASYRVMSNVTTRRKMQFAEKLEKIVRRYTGCGFTPIGGLNVYDRFVEVEKMKVNLEICMDDFLDTVMEELLQTGTRITDLRGTLIESILIQRIQQAIRLDIDRIFHWGNKASTNPDYEQLDGVWTVLYPALKDDNLVPWLNIGTSLTAGDYIDAIRSVWDNAPNELKALPIQQRVFNVDGNFYLGLMEDYENAGGGDGGMVRMIEGSGELQFRGVTVRPQWRWNDLQTEAGLSNSHYVEYTTPLNKVVATDAGGLNPGSDLMIWYEDKDEKVYVKSAFKLGSNYVHHSLLSIGY